ncbi:MAG: hypothetical protein P8Z35_14840 [Ignavibacteriaceae bacterium]
MKIKSIFFIIILLVSSFNLVAFQGNYKNFVVSVYIRAYEVKQLSSDFKKFDSAWTSISNQVKVDKVYIETHRDNITVDDKTIELAKKYFHDKGIITAGGITYTINEGNRFQTFCYVTPEERKEAKDLAELTARHFNEFILDDFFFTNCKNGDCIKAKGNMSWTDFRLKLMTNAAKELVVDPAKAVNPKVKVIIKFPNWYEHFQGLGFNLKDEPKIFDGIYTGTETRDPEYTDQHLQQYESYLIYRYFSNVKPGGNGGGWVDPFGIYYMDRYTEQLWLTLFSKAPEITLFDFRSIQLPVRHNMRASWQSQNTSFNFDEMMKTEPAPVLIAGAAGYTFNKVDKFLDKLGNPVGIKSYKPYNSMGEDFLQNYLGMIGIPMDLVPEFPTKSKMIFLTESAKYDPGIVDKIKGQLMSGKNVMITSGLLKALQGKGIEDIVELHGLNRKSLVNKFFIGRRSRSLYESGEKILIPQIQYLTNDAWEEISGLNSGLGWPLLLSASYGKGTLYVLTIPDNFANLYNLPPEVLNRIRQIVTEDINLRLEGPSKVSLFVYDNNTFIVESFLPEETSVKVDIGVKSGKITDLLTGKEFNLTSEKPENIWRRNSKTESSFEIKIKPHSFSVFRYSE